MLHIAAAALVAASSAHYSTHIVQRVGGQTMVVDGSGVVDAKARIGSMHFRMSGAKSSSGDAIVVARNAVVAYIRGPKTGAPAGKPWGRFGGIYVAPVYDAGVPLRLQVPRDAHLKLSLPRAEIPFLAPISPRSKIVAEVWSDSAGRVVRMRATVHVTRPKRGTISIDERLDAFGTKVAVREPKRSSVFVDLAPRR